MSTVQTWHSLPSSIVDCGDGLVISRGAREFFIGGDFARAAVPLILKAASKSARSLVEIRIEIERQLSSKITGNGLWSDWLEQAYSSLIERAFLIKSEHTRLAARPSESELDVFFWHFNSSATEASRAINLKHTTILGVNEISAQIHRVFESVGYKNYDVVDFHSLRNLRWFTDGNPQLASWPKEAPILDYDSWAQSDAIGATNLIVATSEFGSTNTVRAWNRVAVERGLPYLPVVIDRLVGTVGPLVIPGETACYECFYARENSNSPDPSKLRSGDVLNERKQLISGNHPAMGQSLGSFAGLEITKFLSGVMPVHPAKAFEVRFLAPATLTHPVLRVPRCEVCSGGLRTSSWLLDKESFLPGTPGSR
jgi:bacteriocin biosynthesis cyclodehydratase domain-containing protein